MSSEISARDWRAALVASAFRPSIAAGKCQELVIVGGVP
jgi:hypothetical protein